MDEIKLPYMQLLEEINDKEETVKKSFNEKKKSKKQKKKKVENEEIENNDENSEEEELNLEDDLYSKEVLCKDNSDKLDDFKNGKY